MKKKFMLLSTVVVLGMTVLFGCGKTDNTEKNGKSDKTTSANKNDDSSDDEEQKSKTSSNSEDVLKEAQEKLVQYEGVIEVLCESKAENNVDEFLLLVDYMKSLMRTAVTDDDYFSGISQGYREECGDDFTWSYEITEATPLAEDKIAEYEENVQMFGVEAEIEEAYEIAANVTLTGSKGTKEYTLDLAVGKVGEYWQVVNFNDTLLQ